MRGSFWCRLSSAFGDTSILPRLRGATLGSKAAVGPVDMGALHLLNPQSILELRITFPRESEWGLKQLKRALAASSLSLETLEKLSIDVPDLALILDIESLPPLRPRIRSLKLDYLASIHLDHLRPLAALPNLEDLNFHVSGYSQPPGHPITLARLRSLVISCYKFDVGILFVHAEFPLLQAFSLSEIHDESDIIFENLPSHLRTLVAKCPSLTKLEWASGQIWVPGKGYQGNRRSDSPLAELVAPLLAHRTMRHFSMQFTGAVVPYTPADFSAFAEAWPDLETFCLRDHESGKVCPWTEQCGDVESVFAFARCCPRLRSLWIPRVVVQSESDSTLLDIATHLCPPTPHRWLNRLWVNNVDCSGAQDRDSRLASEAQFYSSMGEVFPSARIRIRCSQKCRDLAAAGDRWLAQLSATRNTYDKFSSQQVCCQISRVAEVGSHLCF